MILAFDRSPDSARTIDDVGRLHVANCPISKAMVCPYYGYEIPGWQELGLIKTKRYMLLRPPEELERAAPSFNNVQVLDDHVPVHAENNGSEPWCGTVSEVFFDGEYLRAGQLSVWTKDAIAAVDSKEKYELSASYAYDPIMEPGTFQGLRYDGRMVNIVGNHVALVEEGRAGPDVHVSDALPKGFSMKVRTVLSRIKRKLAMDADVSPEELVALLGAGAASEHVENDLGEDEDLNDDPNVSSGEMPQAARDFLAGKLSDDDMSELAKCFGPKPADDADPDADGDDDEDEGAEDEAEGEEGDGEEGRGRANDRRPRKPAMDAKAIEARVVRRFAAWNTATTKVEPFIGKVKIAMDAAPDGARGLYRKALDAMGVNHTGIKSTTALERMVDLLPKPQAAFAMDSARASDPSPLDAVLGDAKPIHRS